MRALALAALILLAACGDEAPPHAAAPAATPGGLELPAAGFLGALPPAEGRVTISVDAMGELTIDGKPCLWGDLRNRLDERTKSLTGKTKSGRHAINATMTAEQVEEELEEADDDAPDEAGQEIIAEEPVIRDAEVTHVEEDTELPAEPGAWPRPLPRRTAAVSRDGSRNADVLLRIDRRVPWSVVANLLKIAAHPGLKLHRVFHAVDGADGRGEGALAIFLPKDTLFVPGPARRVVRLTLEAKPAARASEAGALATEIRRRVTVPSDPLEIEVAPDLHTSYGDLLVALDAAVRAAPSTLRLRGHPTPDGMALDWIADAFGAGPYEWTVTGGRRAEEPPEPAMAPRREDGYAGVANDISFEWPEVEDSVPSVR